MAGRTKSVADSRRAVVERAIEIADADGLGALTVRGLARSLGVAPMSLYRHFDSRDQILDGMADALLGRLKSPDVHGNVSPRDYIVELASAFRDLMATHPSVVRLFSSRTTFAEQSLHAAMELPLRGLIDVGFEGKEAIRVYGLIFTFVLGFETYVHPRPWGNHPERHRRQMALYQTLPLPQFDAIVSNASQVASIPSDEQFEFSIHLLADALAPLATR